MDIIGKSAIVETVIGLAVTWFLAAALCTAIVEGVAAVLGFRAKHLWRSVETWFSSGEPTTTRLAVGQALDLARSPSPPRADGNGTSPHVAFLRAIPGLDPEHLTRTKQVNRTAAVAALNAAQGIGTFAGTALGQAYGSLPDDLKNEGRARMEWLGSWFDAEMQRISDGYRARIRWWVAVVGVAVVGFIGLDAAHLATDLYRDPIRRQAFTALAEDLAVDDDGNPCTTPTTTTIPPPTTVAPTTEPPATTAPPATTEPPTTTAPEETPEAEETPEERLKQADRCAREVAGTLDTLGVSRWWGGPPLPTTCAGIVLMIAGLLASAVAVAAGAPFWFSIVKRLVGLRSPSRGSS